jgi:hypothetical protein
MRRELTYEEFLGQKLELRLHLHAAGYAKRLDRNDEIGIQREVYTPGSYFEWGEPEVSYFIDGDPREFERPADLYVGYMENVCGAAEGPHIAGEGMGFTREDLRAVYLAEAKAWHLAGDENKTWLYLIFWAMYAE